MVPGGGAGGAAVVELGKKLFTVSLSIEGDNCAFWVPSLRIIHFDFPQSVIIIHFDFPLIDNYFDFPLW